MTLQRSTLSIPQAATATLTYAEKALFGLISILNSSFLMEISLECKICDAQYFLIFFLLQTPPGAWRSVATPLIFRILKIFCARIFLHAHTLPRKCHIYGYKQISRRLTHTHTHTPIAPGSRVTQVRAFPTFPTTSVILGPRLTEWGEHVTSRSLFVIICYY